MANKVRQIPQGYEHVTPALSIRGAAAAIEFYKKAFGAEELMRMPMPDGRIGHAELRIYHSNIMLADEFPEMGFVSPKTLGGSPVTLHFYVENVDDVYNRAISAGAEAKRPLRNEFYGDRTGSIQDPFGHVWTFSSRIEDLSPEQMNERMNEMNKQK